MFEEVFAGEFARSALPGMLKLARRWRPDVIVRESCEFASPLVAEAVGVPDVHVADEIAGLAPVEHAVGLFEEIAEGEALAAA